MTNKTDTTAALGKYWARLCALPKFSFILSAAGGVARTQDSCGNWVEASAVQQIVDDAESRIAELEAQAAAKCLNRADAAHDPALEKPEAGRYVLAWTEGAKVPIRAMWVPQFHLEMAEDDAETGEYSEEKDQYFCPAGWYENNAHEETHWSVSTPVVAWMELPRRSAALQATPPAQAYSIDADPQGIRAYVADAITGALACGAQGSGTPPPDHWLTPFWRQARFGQIQYNALRDATDALLNAPGPAQEHATQLAGQGQDFDAWQSNPYTKVLLKSIAEDYVPKVAQAQEDARDAARWRQVLRHVGGQRHPFCQTFGLVTLKPVSGNIMQGSAAEHFTKAIDAARAAQGGA